MVYTYQEVSKYLESLLERTPDLYLHELRKDLVSNRSVYVSLSTISRTLQKRGLTRKKLTIPAREQDEQLRGEYLARIQQYHPRQLQSTHLWAGTAGN